MINTAVVSRVHVVRQGECLASIAARYGFRDASELHDLPENAELARDRPDPHVLAPGDRVFIPDRPERRLRLDPGGTQRFRARTTELRVRLEDHDGSPLGDRLFELAWGGRRTRRRTGSDGMIVAKVPVSLRRVDALVWLDPSAPDDADESLAQAMVFSLGALDPVTEPSGVRDRLANLGLLADEGRRVDEDERSDALEALRAAAGLPEGSEIDDAALRRLHGGR